MSKMTDVDIVKGFECCILNATNCTGGCPYRGTSEAYSWEPQCWNRMKKDVRDLISRQRADIESLQETLSIFRDDMHLLIDKKQREIIEDVILQLEAEIESSDKYIREYDDSELQKAYNQGLRAAHNAVKGMIGEQL